MTTMDYYINAARRALDRAYAEGAHARFAFVESDGERFEALYNAPGGHVYWITSTGCSCEAGSRNMICKHLVSGADKAGLLDHYIPGCYERGFAVAPQLAA